MKRFPESPECKQKGRTKAKVMEEKDRVLLDEVYKGFKVPEVQEEGLGNFGALAWHIFGCHNSSPRMRSIGTEAGNTATLNLISQGEMQVIAADYKEWADHVAAVVHKDAVNLTDKQLTHAFQGARLEGMKPYVFKVCGPCVLYLPAGMLIARKVLNDKPVVGWRRGLATSNSAVLPNLQAIMDMAHSADFQGRQQVGWFPHQSLEQIEYGDSISLETSGSCGACEHPKKLVEPCESSCVAFLLVL